MKDILKSAFIREFSEIVDQMYKLGWDERNGGNVSYILDESEVRPYLNPKNSVMNRKISLDFDASEIVGRIFLVTATGKFFRNLKKEPETNCGILRVDDRSSASILWGFKNCIGPTSEINSHLHAHIVRLQADSNHRVVIHCHATNLLAMTFVHNLDEAEFSKTLWRMCTECIIVFPEGVGVVPWMVPGNNEIGQATAEKLSEKRLVIWPMHGVFGCGNNLDETFGLIETAEKAAEIYLKIAHLPIRQELTDEQLKVLATAFKVTPKMGYLK